MENMPSDFPPCPMLLYHPEREKKEKKKKTKKLPSLSSPPEVFSLNIIPWVAQLAPSSHLHSNCDRSQAYP